MNYELAKQLKDAGFPQIKGNGVYLSDVGILKDDCGELGAYFPSLSELIEAFDGKYKYIDGLINDAQFILAKTVNHTGNLYIARLDGQWESVDIELKYRFVSSSPEEAVSCLWLALQENKKIV
jgi:hypothetical protein